MKKREVILKIVVVSALAMLQGCVVVAAGAAAAGTVAYVRGDLESIMEEDITAIYESSKQALRDLEIEIVGTDKDLLSAVVNGKGAEDKKIVIKMKRIEQGRLVKLTIRIGTFGDKTLSQIIYNKIHKNLEKYGTKM
ncbi:MAG: DUF3568 family protein [Sedimentisphaerales bacterium]|nr:DUF3568 family protein [Sedimentisphaerales bacterium]